MGYRKVAHDNGNVARLVGEKPMLMTAKYPGVCSISGARIRPGDRIEWNRKTRKAVLVVDDTDTMASETCAVLTSPVSHVYRFASGAVGYRNKRGLCEDAPCCGCCTV